MRIDAHHSYSERYPLEHLRIILARNKFEGSIAVVSHPLPMWHVLRTDLTKPYLLDEHLRGLCYKLADDLPPGLDDLARRRIPLDLDLGPQQLSLIPRIAGLHPDLMIALDHLARPPIHGPMDEWARDLERAAQYPNVYAKLSGITTPDFRPAVQHALAVFGPRRLMFGSDWPGHLPDVTWKATLAAFTQSIGAQPIEVREELLGGTAERFYQLPPRSAA
ncbi:MAG TPA: amidohydrolase family protein [Bryobacteraceae bacterium]|nr:amidohydrolase family protein [Bryobacteraceae bacterium]